MRVRGPDNVGRAVRTDPSYGDHGKKKRNFGSCLLKSLTGYKLCATTPNRQHATGQQGVQKVATCNIQQCWELFGTERQQCHKFLKTEE